MLTKDQILYLLEELSWETIPLSRPVFNDMRIQKKQFGYSDDKDRGVLQAALSIMLEVASKREEVLSEA